MSADRAAWVESLFERFDGEWFSSDVGDLRHNPAMPALLMKLATIAVDHAEVLVWARDNQFWWEPHLFNQPWQREEMRHPPIPWREAMGMDR